MHFEKRINQLKIRFSELETKLSDPATVSDQTKYRELTKEYSGAKKILDSYIIAVNCGHYDLWN